MKDFLEDSYIVLTATGVYDRGLNKEEAQEQYFAMIGLDTDGDGIISKDENDAVRARLYQIAIDAGAGEILDKFDSIIPKHLCVDFNKGGKIASDDSVSTFNKGQELIINKEATFNDGTKRFPDATDADVFSGSWDMIRFLEARGAIIGRRFMNKDGSLNLELLASQTEPQASLKPMTDSLVHIDEKTLNSIKDGLNTAKTLFTYLQGAYPAIKPASVLFSITDYIFDKDLVGSSKRETFREVIKRVLHV